MTPGLTSSQLAGSRVTDAASEQESLSDSLTLVLAADESQVSRLFEKVPACFGVLGALEFRAETVNLDDAGHKLLASLCELVASGGDLSADTVPTTEFLLDNWKQQCDSELVNDDAARQLASKAVQIWRLAAREYNRRVVVDGLEPVVKDLYTNISFRRYETVGVLEAQPRRIEYVAIATVALELDNEQVIAFPANGRTLEALIARFQALQQVMLEQERELNA